MLSCLFFLLLFYLFCELAGITEPKIEVTHTIVFVVRFVIVVVIICMVVCCSPTHLTLPLVLGSLVLL